MKVLMINKFLFPNDDGTALNLSEKDQKWGMLKNNG